MKLHRFKRILSLILVAALLVGYYVPSAQAAEPKLSWKETDKEIRLDLSDRQADIHVDERYKASDIVRVSIVLEEKSTIQAGYPTRDIARNSEAMAYNRALRAKQDVLAQAISTQVLGGKKLDVKWNLTLVGNIISANVPYGKISDIAQVDGVKDVVLENRYEPCVVDREAAAQPQMYASLEMAGSSLVWKSGFTGAGSRIAVLDTGTDTQHQSMDAGAFLYSLEQNAKAKGMSYEDYVASLDLLDQQEITSVLTDLNIYEMDDGISAYYLYLNEKLPFAVNYVDGIYSRYVVDHTSDKQGEHGSHVAGIATANRYIPSGDGYADALETVLMAGNAPDAQLITMKVFGSSGGPSDSDYMAAIEDAIILGCDSVNLSLGSGMAGHSYNTVFADLLEYLTTTDTVVVGSAGNSYSWPETTPFGYLYADDVNMATGGAPGSYYSFLTVASVENDGGVGLAFNAAGHNTMYADSTDGSYYPFYSLDTTSDASGTEYDFVFVDGLGYEEDYAGMDLTGKVVFCSRGVTNFAVKAEVAASLGAAATVIYNNDSSGAFGMDLSGYTYTNPCVSIAQSDADAIRAAATVNTTSAGLVYYTGKITVYGDLTGFAGNSQYYTMSDFSSWGLPGSLSLKPEITAPGGNIYSLNGKNYYGGGHDQYELMSGTSMSAPQITGMVALMAQYLRESGLAQKEGLSVRHLAQSLLMSTSVPMLEADSGSYYSLLKQGSGLARVDLAASASSYILVQGQPDGKVKAELGDDPNRTGVYSFSFTINNLSGEAESYTLSADLFRQDAFEYTTGSGVYLMDKWTTSLPATASFSVNGVPVDTGADLSAYDLNGDGATDSWDADYLLEYLLGNESQLHGTGDVNADGNVNTYDAHVLLTLLSSTGDVTVPANGSITVDVTLAITPTAKQQMNDLFPNGTYVEAFVYAEAQSSSEGVAGTCHSIPVLAYYGDWSDPNMFDYSTAVDMMYDNATRMPYLYYESSTGSANALTIDYGDGGEYYFGGNPYVQDAYYIPERNAFNSQDASYLYAQYFSLIRNAGNMQLVITNADTGEVYMNKLLGDCYAAFYFVNGGYWENIEQGVNVGWSGLDASGNPLPNGTKVDVSLVAATEYYRKADGTYDMSKLGEGAFLTTSMTIDNISPEMKSADLVDTTLTVTAQDNRHVAAVMVLNKTGTTTFAAATPNQVSLNELVTVELDLTGVMGENFLIAVCDYAGNMTAYEVTLELPEIERPYFTVVDYGSSTYYGLNEDGTTITLATGNRGTIQAAEFVDGYVFEVTDGGYLHVASDSDLNNFRYLNQFDTAKEYWITNFADMAYNYADGQLYGLFYAEINYEAAPYLCTIDMATGQWDVIGELPVDVNNMAIDDEGNFYSVAYNSPDLYTYTLADLENGNMNYVGQVGSYATNYLNSLAWDHDQDTLYWAFPDTLLRIDPATGTPTLLSYVVMQMTGLYIRPAAWGDRFAPTETVKSVTLDYTENRVLVGSSISLTAQVWPWNISNSKVTWTSSDASIATVSDSGLVNGFKEGEVTITATSVLDPSKSASCRVIVEDLDKTLHGFVWDEEGYVWWSEFNNKTLPSYTKLTTEYCDDAFATSAMMPDGTLYVSTIDTSTGYLRSNVYEADPDTLDLSFIGASTAGYADITAAPSIRGGALAAVYGNYLLFVNTSDGDYYYDRQDDLFQMFQYNVVGIAYAGSAPYTDYGYNAMLDWFFIIDAEGYVYLLGFMEVDGQILYVEHPATVGGIYTVTNAVSDTGYFSSAYFDGEFLYYSCFNSEKNVSTLYAIDTMGYHKCYNLGNFGAAIWPAGGLMELDNPPATDLLNVKVTMEPKAAETAEKLAPMSVTALEKAEPVSDGGLNSVVELLSSGEFDEDTLEVTVVLTPVGDSPNGRITLTYDPDIFVLYEVSGNTEAFAYTAMDGTITVAFASAHTLNEDYAVATVTFVPMEYGEHTATVTHIEAWDEPSGKEEILTIICGCNHSYHAAVHDPTCTEQGYTQYFCEFCDETYIADYVPALGHSFTKYLPNGDATCTEDGTMTASCDHGCGMKSTVIDAGSAKGHSYTAVVTAPTCTDQGYTTYTCSNCGHRYEDDYVTALGHSFTDYQSNGDATCTEDGTMTASCDRGCGMKSTVTDTSSAKGHSYTSVVTAPTCTDQGYTTYTCATCGYSYEDDFVAALGHSFTDYQSNGDATCTEDGTMTASCDRGCGTKSTVTDTGSAKDHSYTSVVTAPTCTEQGYTLYFCEFCDESYIADYVPALGHSFTKYLPNGDATCEEDGTKTASCDHGCGMKSTVIDAGSAKGHSYTAVVTAPTCQAQGYTTYTCANCGHSYVSDYVDPVDHSYENGECIWCGDILCTAEFVSASASLGGDISLHFYAVLSDSVLNDPNAFVRFSFAGRYVDVPVSQGVEDQKNGVTRYRFTCKLTAKNMADAVTAQVMNANGPVGESKTLALATYGNALISAYKGTKLAELVKAMLNYGAAVQIQFNYNVDNLPNAELSDEDKILPDVDASAYAHSLSGSEDGLQVVGAYLMVDSETTARITFKLTGTKTVDQYTFTINGKTVTPTLDGDRYYLEVRNLGAHELDRMQVFTLGGITFRYGALSYVNQVFKSSASTEQLKNVAKALYAYYEAAKAYLG